MSDSKLVSLKTKNLTEDVNKSFLTQKKYISQVAGATSRSL